MTRNLFLKLFLLLSVASFAQQVTISPATFDVTDEITITVSFASATCNTMGNNPAKVYMHAGIGNETNAFGFSVVGNWGFDDGVGQMTSNGDGTFSITLTPSTYFNLNGTQQAGASKLGFVFRNANGTQTLKKATTCGDFIYNVGAFHITLISPAANSTTILNSGGNVNVQCSNTNGVANYELKSNGATLQATNNTSFFSYNHTNITQNQNYELIVTQGTQVQSRKFMAMVNPGTLSEALPSATLEDGINYNPADATQVTLVLDAPGKDYVYVAGSFNNYGPTANYAMKKDPATGKFWYTLTGLTPNVDYNYQYWVVDTTPFTNSPAFVKTADPYSTMVLSPYDDGGIPATNYPNIPAYPTGQSFEVTNFKTGQTPYNWQVTNFVKPAKEDLVIYEVLVRDFDSRRSYQDLIDKIDYFKSLNINAIQLMPVMEYEGNESWGYNTAYHMAADKFYGPSDKLKELIDLCHQNGIAVILDVALNHAFGRNPMVRMWMTDPDGDGFGNPTSESPYFNVNAMHSYNVGSDFNHQQPRTKNYVKRVVKQWIQEYHIDGFRWDLTKGFTQECPSTVAGGQDACTNGYRADRVAVLKEYADYSWSIDPTHYTIFEHLGQDNEEQQWANYRVNETPSKGIMTWAKMTDNYNQLSMGFASSADISRVGSNARGFQKYRAVGYAESHDEERLMYKNVTYGNNTNASHNVRNLPTALSRMSAIGAVSLLVPGPKMIWHFGELGWNSSIWTCYNGTVNTDSDSTPGDCKLDTKPQPQWSGNWETDVNRAKIFSDWARMIELKTNEPVFKATYDLNTSAANLTPRLYVYDNALPSTQLKNVVVLTNFTVNNQNIVPDFPYTGVWYDLMDNSPVTVSSTTAQIAIPAGQFRVFGNQPSETLNTDRYEIANEVALFPNPSANNFYVSTNTSKVEVYAITGQLVQAFKGQQIGGSYDVSSLNKGVYLVKITDTHQRSKTVKLIKE